MAEAKRDYYEVLGVDKNADENTIKKAYRKLAKENHPDYHPGDAECEKRFKEASEAYAVLSDADKRRKYDQFGHAAFEQGAGGSPFGQGGFEFTFDDIFGSDIFSEFFGGGRSRRSSNGPMKGKNVRVHVEIDFLEAVFGCEKEITFNYKEECPTCSGSGAKPGTTKETCPRCSGSGQTRMPQSTIFGLIQGVVTCPQCNGSGKIIKEKCTDCGGTGYKVTKMTKKVKIVAGIDDGQAIRDIGFGEPGVNGGPRGDLIVEVRVRHHDTFQRDGMDIYSTVPISYAVAALGGDILIDTVDGKRKYTVKAGVQTGTAIRFRGSGVQSIRNKDIRGDHFVTLVVQTPTGLNHEAKELLKKFDEITGNSLKEAEKYVEEKDKGEKEPAKKKKGFFK